MAIAPPGPGVDEGPEIDSDQISVVADPARPRLPEGALAGLVAGAVAVTIGMLVAGILEVVSPIDAVGSEVIDRAPLWLKEQSIEWFGTNDKLALRVGIVVLLALAALAFGTAAVARPLVGAVGIGAFGVIGALAALNRPTESGSALFPPVIGTIVGIILLGRLLRVPPAGPRETPGPSRVPLGWDRRRFLVTSGTATAVAVGAGFGAQALERRRIDDIEDAIPDTPPPVAPSVGSSAPAIPAGADVNPATPYVTPNDDFYRIDTALSFPRVDLATWRVDIGGMVSNPISLSYDDLLARPQIERIITLCCVSNEVGGPYIGNAVWQGVLLADLLTEAGVDPGAEQLFSTSLDGWTCGFPTSVAVDGRDAMVAIAMNGEALPLAHGFPARLVVPGLYGYVSATKWLRSIELTTWDADVGYWVPRGWARDAPIKTHSRIDVPRRNDELSAGPVVVAGIAWAQHRGIERVEVRVDDGEWADATLAVDVTDDSWRQWTFLWDATTGEHRLRVRATDKSGATQTEEVAPVAPDGATGYHQRRVNVS